MKKLKEIPKFKTEKEEKEFWLQTDSTDYVDWNEAQEVYLINAKKTSRNISLSLPVDLIERIKVQAHKSNIPYQSLIKLYISRQLAEDARIVLSNK